MGLFSKKVDAKELLKQADEAIIKFEFEKTKIGGEKDSLMKRQVEIWSISTAESSQGLEDEYRHAASGVAYDVKKLICLDEHLKKIRLAQFHAKNGNTKDLEEILAITDPCANISSEVEKPAFQSTSAQAA